MKVICDEAGNTKEDMEKRQINMTLVPENKMEACEINLEEYKYPHSMGKVEQRPIPLDVLEENKK